jgi:hypothetical protein
VTPNQKENTRHPSASEYVRAIFDSSDRLAVLVRNSRRGETIQRITSSARIAEPAFQKWLQFKNESESCDIYIGMNTLKPDARSRTKEDIHTIRHLYLDIDHDGVAALANVRKSSLVPPPNYTLSTSPEKFQVLWRVENISLEEAEILQRAMAREFGADPAATDATRVLRLPGFLNRKYDAEFRVQAEQHSNRIHHPPDFRLRTESIENDLRPGYQPRTQAPSTPQMLSQSERDWAYAKRALARGDDPEEIIRRIADFRRDEKSDPVYYARHTVCKAQAQFVSGSSDAKTTKRGSVAREKTLGETPSH